MKTAVRSRPGSPELPDASHRLQRGQILVLLSAVFASSICAIGYELVIGATGTYIAGDGVTQFALTIGIFLFSMGLGSLFSQKIRTSDAILAFTTTQILIGLFGGISHPVLYILYAAFSSVQLAIVFFLFIIGFLTGLEIPLITRVLTKNSNLRVNISNVLSLDYFGALVSSVGFPLIILPAFGLWTSSMLFGLLNVLLGYAMLAVFRDLKHRRLLLLANSASLLVLILFMASGFRIQKWADEMAFGEEVVFKKHSRFQSIVLTRWRQDLRMYLNGNLQFSSTDEYRYHEALVHPLFSAIPSIKHVLVLGGGDGLALREILKYPGVMHVDLVDLDPEVTKVSRTNPHIAELNRNSLSESRVHIHHMDAWLFVRETRNRYDAIVVDLPDPGSDSLVKLYSLEFYRMLAGLLHRDGGLSVQATSPFFTRRAFWNIVNTIRATGLNVKPIHINVPSFGEWGFVLGTPFAVHNPGKLQVPTRYLTNEMLQMLHVFPSDMQEIPTGISTLLKPVILSDYLEGQKKFFP